VPYMSIHCRSASYILHLLLMLKKVTS
jgi:hypothetical protein